MSSESEKEFWRQAEARSKPKRETETELYAIFVDGVLVERGEREVYVDELDKKV